MRVYYDRDADVNLIKDKKVAIIGYGSQGHAHANNLKDSGVTEVVVGLREGSTSIPKAENAGLKVMTPADAAAWADVTMILAPDELQADLYVDELRDNLGKAALAFAHGLSVHFRLIEPSISMCLWLRPKAPAIPSALSLSVAAAAVLDCRCGYWRSRNRPLLCIGYWRRSVGCYRTTFREECETDLFGEQAVLCGGLTSLITAGYETLVEAGYAPEMAYFECLTR